MKSIPIASLFLFLFFSLALPAQNERSWDQGRLTRADFIPQCQEGRLGELHWDIVAEKKVQKQGNLSVHYYSTRSVMDPKRSWVNPDLYNQQVLDYLQTEFDWVESNRRSLQSQWGHTIGRNLYEMKHELRKATETYRRDCNDGYNTVAVSEYKKKIEDLDSQFSTNTDSLFSRVQAEYLTNNQTGLFLGFNNEWSRVFANEPVWIPLLTVGINGQYKRLFLEFEILMNFGTHRSPRVNYHDLELAYDWAPSDAFGALEWCLRGGYQIINHRRLSIYPFVGVKKESLFQYIKPIDETNSKTTSSWIEGFGGQFGLAFNCQMRRDLFLSTKRESYYETKLVFKLFGDMIQFQSIGPVWSINAGVAINLCDYLSTL